MERRGHNWQYKKSFSILAGPFQLAGCPCQIALTVFDNHGHPRVHRSLLFLALIGTALSAICTVAAFWDIMKAENSKGNKLLRRAIVISNSLFLMEFCLGVAFTGLISMSFYRISGIVEWVMAYWFTFYFLAFAGFLVVPEEEAEARTKEETPLLR